MEHPQDVKNPADGQSLLTDGLDAERWRTFLRVAEKSINRDKGCITFWLPRWERSFMTFEQAIDAEIKRVSNV